MMQGLMMGLLLILPTKKTDPQQKIALIKSPPLGNGETVAEKFCTVKIKKL